MWVGSLARGGLGKIGARKAARSGLRQPQASLPGASASRRTDSTCEPASAGCGRCRPMPAAPATPSVAAWSRPPSSRQCRSHGRTLTPRTSRAALLHASWARADGEISPGDNRESGTWYRSGTAFDSCGTVGGFWRCKFLVLLVGAARFELATPSPPDWCANQAALRSDDGSGT